VVISNGNHDITPSCNKRIISHLTDYRLFWPLFEDLSLNPQKNLPGTCGEAMGLAGGFRQAVFAAAGQNVFDAGGKIDPVAHRHKHQFDPGNRLYRPR